METQATKSPHTLFWIAGTAVTVFSVAGIAAIMGWIPTSTSSPAENTALSRQSTAPAKPAAARAHTATTQAQSQAPVQVASNTPAKARCVECGVIESVREIETKGEGSGLGAVGGAVVGGLLGHQVGGGRGQDVATVVGAVGGAVAGNEVEKRVKSGKSYEITIRFEDGSSRAIHEASAPSWRTGDRVKVIDGVIHSNS